MPEITDKNTLWEALLDTYTEEEALLFLTSPQDFWDGKVPAVEMAKGSNLTPMWGWLEGRTGQVTT